jgi:hypothetical protein
LNAAVLADDIRRNAALYRDGIAYGVLAPDDAVAWADSLIESRDRLPTAMYDLSVAPGKSAATVIEALGRLTDIPDVTDATARALLDVLDRQLNSGLVTPTEALVTAHRLTRPLGPDSSVWLDAFHLEDQYALARDGIYGSLADLQSAVRSWLAGFRGSSAGFHVHAA